MNVGHGPSDPPDRAGEGPSSIGERRESSGPQNWAGLIAHAIANWSTTWRLVVLIAAIVAIGVLGAGAIWLLNLNVSVGWLQISQS